MTKRTNMSGFLKFEESRHFKDFLEAIEEDSNVNAKFIAWAPLKTVAFFEVPGYQYDRIMEMSNQHGIWHDSNELAIFKPTA